METAQLIQQAESAIRNNNMVQARALLRQAVRQNPYNDQAWLLLARATPNANLAREYINRAQSLQQAIPLRKPRQDTRRSNETTRDGRIMRWQYGLLALAATLLLALAILSVAGRPWQQAIALQVDGPAQIVSSAFTPLSAELNPASQPQTAVQSDPNRGTSREVFSADLIPGAAPSRTINKANVPAALSEQAQDFEAAEAANGDGSELALPAAIISGLESEALSSAESAEQLAGSEGASRTETQAGQESAAEDAQDGDSAFAEDDRAVAEEIQDLRALESESAAVQPGDESTLSGAATDDRWIDVNLTTQTLTAYEGETPVLSSLVSSGMWQFPTITGEFHTYMKLETQNMSGYHLGYNYYLENVPHVMYFHEDYALHGAYWHNDFGTPMSHGCVNMNLADAGWIFDWAPIGTLVNIHY